jgi:peptidyl-prolyl cis-trans isomerase SurA
VRFLLFVLCTALSLPAAAGEIIEEIAAKVNSEVITKSELERQRQELRQALQQQMPNDPQRFQTEFAQIEKDLLRELIDNALLTQRGKEMNINVDAEVVKRLDRIRKEMGLNTLDDLERAVNSQGGNFEDYKTGIKNDLIKQQVIGREVGSRLQVAADRIKQWYDTNKQKLERPEEVRIREILISTEGKEGPEIEAAEKKAKEVLEKMKKSGANFADLALQYSDGATAKTAGGDIGFFKRGMLNPEIEKIAFSLKRGQTSDLIRTKYGFEIIRVEERHQAGIPSLEDAEEEIQQELYMEDIQPALRKYLTKLREEAYIEVKAGYTDTGAAGDESYARLIPKDMTEDELIAPKARRHRSLLPPFRKR